MAEYSPQSAHADEAHTQAHGVEALKGDPAGAQSSELNGALGGEAEIKARVASIHAALGRRRADQQAIWGALNGGPEVVARIKAVYDRSHGDLMGDLRAKMAPRDLDLALAQLGRAGIDVGGSVKHVQQEADGKHQGPHRVIAEPALPAAMPGTQIQYRVDMDAEMYGADARYSYQWYCLNDPVSAKGLGAPNKIDGPNDARWDASWDFVGNHKVMLRLQFHPGQGPAHAPEFIEYRQAVIPQLDVASQAFSSVKTPGDPAQTLEGFKRYVALQRLAASQPGSQRLNDEKSAAMDAYIQALGEKLEGTEGAQRIPIKAVHVATESGRVTPLNIFVARTSSREGRQRWALVDITGPTDRRLTGEYEGSAATASEAINAAIDAWDRANRYPTGLLRLEVPSAAAGAPLARDVQTDGMSFWDSISEFFNTVGLVTGLGALALGVATAIAPIPGSRVVSAMIWTSIITSTAGAAINMTQRHAEGFANFNEDAMDVLTIAGNMLGGAGMWARGASLTMSGAKGVNLTRAFIIGSITTDGAQGVLMGSQFLGQYEEIMAMGDPQKRTDALLELLRSASIAGAMTLISFKGNMGDLKAATGQSVSLTRLADPNEDIACAPLTGSKLNDDPSKAIAPPTQPKADADKTVQAPRPRADDEQTQLHPTPKQGEGATPKATDSATAKLPPETVKLMEQFKGASLKARQSIDAAIAAEKKRATSPLEIEKLDALHRSTYAEMSEEYQFLQQNIRAGHATPDHVRAFFQRKHKEFQVELKYRVNITNEVNSPAGGPKQAPSQRKPWSEEELAVLDESLARLPESHVKGNPLLKELRRGKVRQNWSRENGGWEESARTGGDHSQGIIRVFDTGTNENLNFRHNRDVSNFSGNSKPVTAAEMVIIHELGHDMHDNMPDVFKRFQQAAGWQTETGDALVSRLMGSGMNEAQARGILKQLDEGNLKEYPAPDGRVYKKDVYRRGYFWGHERGALPEKGAVPSTQADGFGAQKGTNNDTWSYARTHPKEAFAEMYVKAATVPEQLYVDMVTGPQRQVAKLQQQYDALKAQYAHAQQSQADAAALEAIRQQGWRFKQQLERAMRSQQSRQAQWDIMRKEIYGLTDDAVQTHKVTLMETMGKVNPERFSEASELYKQFERNAQVIATPYQLTSLFDRYKAAMERLQ
ncbi:hypothetical protein KKB55_20990 [Myxococcota bacterium]|nr:hypothetical protein [Myxococcota bacterium]MBU1900224.1 hypothetical protein [Myxococcota bacterium]